MIRITNSNGLFDFQFEACEWLLDKTLPDGDSTPKTFIMKAPTGSGKTIILLNYINEYFNEAIENTSFIWLSIGSGELEEQSKEKMDKFLPDRNSKTLSDVLQSGFEGNEVTFINWESVTKKHNKATSIRETKNIKNRIADAHRNNIEFIIIIDEEHRNNTPKAQEFVDNFSARNTIRVSATTIQNDLVEKYEISESDVIASGLITSAMYVNDQVEDNAETDIGNEYAYLIEMAMKKRKEIQNEYSKLEKKIRPLVIIQFPDSSNSQINEVEQLLAKEGYTYENGFVAKWLSEEKINIEGIEDNNAAPIFLIWKQALSTGWDCPRAKILVKLRDNMSDSFEIQTIGRIRRMPEARHYGNELLDSCFMYTFDEEWKEQALKDKNAFETKKVFIKNDGKKLTLTREVRDSSSSNFGEREVREIFSNYFVNKYNLTKGLRLSKEVKEANKKKMEANSWVFGTEISRVYLKGRFVQISDLTSIDLTRKGVTTREVNTHYNGRDKMHIINELHRIISISDSAIQSIIKTLFHTREYRRADNLLALSNLEWYAFIINNRDLLKEAFREVKAQDLSEKSKHEQLTMKMEEFDDYFKEREFRIPLSEIYKFDSSRQDLEGQKLEWNVYKDYQKNMVTDKTRSRIEQKFEYYCESKINIEWIYKNGDKGDKYFSIAYRDGIGQVRLFYPDYIVQMTNGETWIIETKGGERSSHSQNIDPLSSIKFDAFKKYVEKRHPELNWGFVRDIGEQLYLNNSEWTESIAGSEKWQQIENHF
ncbi:DEAD/DEAH box helicase [Staphylococcus haemolyticus]|uniref:DEAD/DEAH box helicase n=2 Tax=Staphylococcus TaxID=1279 RepID=UPI0028855ADA|nr:DEAD/DEAH box helicase family protein [Staphylococcus haemolyticus]MDT0705714.1 DEAD/DEAH box helicase family protein [Staphylococcus haemolyticus]